ncbi:M6 family metalloprotease domain-containing protein [Streptomyces armeniacus]|uniref:M6 family metalloprotease domain-containing protein n=1 Tax=Streptomyces armeniacus TaxID=83291 RepID=A0A345XY06_9ACTN|nr:immune inhibitor A domain-containing protein [Streptomyces armeniacus]AXK36522.1 M6 family metalloprotease domain-containing protein [Streptomyces armeniacus]
MNSRRRSIRSRSAALATAVAALGAAVLLPANSAQAQPDPQPKQQADTQAERGKADPAEKQQPSHNLDGPFSAEQRTERQAALQKLASGDGEKGQADTFSRDDSKVMKLGDEKYVELAREKTDKIFTILVEFGDKVDPKYGGTPGPLHNQIKKPDRKDDNSTYWKEDFNREHFTDLYFGEDTEDSLKTYYEKQSSGRYSVEGTVSDWVKVDHNEARYGSNYCGDTTCPTVWDAIRDGVESWIADQKADGKTDDEIAQLISEYDEWDRYDFDGDGDFNESDGYIDHFQFIHAGEDESAGGGEQGEDAIWAHRWYAYGTDAGHTGPDGNKSGGTEIGDTGIWVGDYTAQPENGGLGVFAHEYGHDLGLPDHYDTTGTGENSVGFWSLMSSGSWLNKGKDAIGDSAGDLNAWDKFQLGWLDYETAKAATKSTHTLGSQSYQTKNPQALIVELPKKKVTTTITKPAEGDKQWWSGSGDNLRNTMSRSVDLTGKSSASLDLKGWWDIEENYDYLYTEVSTDGGANWTPLDGTADGEPIPRDGGDRPALSGVSESYRDLSYPLDEYAGKKVDLRFRYLTDGGVAQKGFAADAVSVTADGEKVFEDGAEGDDNGWTADGFSRIGESFTKDYEQFYIAENRQHVGYDKSLAHGPYNFGWPSTRPDWVERYDYQKGLLIWLWDTSQADNNVGVHPGEGLILPVDAHAKPERWSNDDSLMRGRIQAYDSPFSWYPSNGMKLHNDGKKTVVWPKWGTPVFDDHKGTYWYESNPQAGVKVPDTNTRIKILKQPFSGKTITVGVGPSTS